MKKNPFKNLKLDAYEKELEKALEKDPWESVVDDIKKTNKAGKRIAYNTDVYRFGKDKAQISVIIPFRILKNLEKEARMKKVPINNLVVKAVDKYVR